MVQGGIQKSEDIVTGTKETIGRKMEKLLAEPLQPQYETTLKRITPERFDEYAETAKKAARDYKEITPLQLAGQKAQGALDTIQIS